MLASTSSESTHVGSLGRDVHPPATFFSELLDFINNELPRWRDRAERPTETAETTLTSQLCAHLNSAARRSSGWDILQFKTEEPDDQVKGRRIDLVAAPSDATIWVEGRRYIDFDTLLPIECKRLPTPGGSERDDREYIFNRHASTGGVQRFKAGHHGANHKLGAMIAYVQKETSSFWNVRVAEWINELVVSGQEGWTTSDLLHFERENAAQKVAVLSSIHARGKDLPEIELRHLWIQMN